jgi:hypothetical protein
MPAWAFALFGFGVAGTIGVLASRWVATRPA